MGRVETATAGVVNGGGWGGGGNPDAVKKEGNIDSNGIVYSIGVQLQFIVTLPYCSLACATRSERGQLEAAIHYYTLARLYVTRRA